MSDQRPLWTLWWPCIGCNKRTFATRRAAKRALRIYHPGHVGRSMEVYPCRHGGTGWHHGHRNPRHAYPEFPEAWRWAG